MDTWISTTSGSNSSRSSPIVVLLTVLAWASAAFTLDATVILPTFHSTTNALTALGQAILLLALHLTWLSLAYLLVSLLCRAAFSTPPPTLTSIVPTPTEVRVAVLLCVRDDWIEESAASCIESCGPRDLLVICDDSKSAACRAEIDRFAKSRGSLCRIFRRPTLVGFKAGNLNYALAMIGSEYDFVLVVDHDNRLHPRAIPRGAALLQEDPGLAFVQLGQQGIEPEKRGFSSDAFLFVDIVWWMQSLRATHGLPTSFGHCVMYRKSALDEVEGFPEMVTEDLAVTLRLVGRGWRGTYDLSTPCLEEVPWSYARFRSRQARWCLGALQTWLNADTRLPMRHLRDLRSWDGLLQGLILWWPILALGFGAGVILSNISDAGFPATWRPVIGWSTLLAMSLPVVPAVLAAGPQWRRLRCVLPLLSVHLSLAIPVACNVSVDLLAGKGEFVNSGNRDDRLFFSKWSIGSSGPRLLSVNGWGIISIELAVLLMGLFMAPELGYMSIPLLLSTGAGLLFQLAPWESKLVTFAKYAIPLALFLVGVAFATRTFGG